MVKVLWLLLLHSSRDARREVCFKASSVLPWFSSLSSLARLILLQFDGFSGEMLNFHISS